MNLILDEEVQLAQWKDPLAAVFPTVWLSCSENLARREGLPEDRPNELTVEDGTPHLFILARPTTIDEYEPDELEALRSIVGEAKQKDQSACIWRTSRETSSPWRPSCRVSPLPAAVSGSSSSLTS